MFEYRFPVLSTIFSDAKPLTEHEKRHLADEWAERTLNTLIAYAERNKPFAKKLCKEVANTFGPDDELSGLLIQRLRVDRTGKPKGPNKKWTDVRYWVLLMEYNVLCGSTERSETLEILAEKEGFTGDNAAKGIEAKITEARKLFGREALPEFFNYPPASHKKGG